MATPPVVTHGTVSTTGTLKRKKAESGSLGAYHAVPSKSSVWAVIVICEHFARDCCLSLLRLVAFPVKLLVCLSRQNISNYTFGTRSSNAHTLNAAHLAKR